MKRFINMLPTLAFGDAVGNDTLAIHNSLKNAGYESMLMASVIDRRIPEDIKSTDEWDLINDDDVIIYHMSTGDPLNEKVSRLNNRMIIRYHNITPPEFFFGYNKSAMSNCTLGYRDLYAMRNLGDYLIADSEYNLGDLRKNGYTAPGEVMPILIPFKDYEKKPDEDVINRMSDGRTNIVFTGRVVPNKRQEQVIRAFYHYKKAYDDSARLILVGNYEGMELYYESLVDYAAGLGISDDVIFTGHISFPAILAYYRTASAFLCMSDHEGFCVPLVEAMFFDIPVIAKKTSAIPYTLGGAGILLENDDPLMAAAVINRVLKDEDLRNKVLENQRERLKDFEHDKIEKQLLDAVNRFIKQKD